MKEKLLDKINFPSDLRLLKKDQLEQVSKELREEVIDVVSETGGHLGAGLGVIELTVALHFVFNTPKDKLVWEVYLVLPKEVKANMILLVPHIAQLQFHLHWEWPLQRNYLMIITM